MTEVSSAEFLKLSLQEVADLLLDKLSENERDGKEYSMCKLHGCSEGRMFEMSIIMRGVENGKEMGE